MRGLLVGSVGAALTFALLSAILPGTPLDYDEADYASAASRGVVVNALDADTIGIAQFVRLGWRSVAGGGADRGGLSAYVRSADDVGFYRHFHGPLFFYGLVAAARATAFDERALRTVAAASVALAAGLAAFFAVRLAAAAGLAHSAVAGVVALAFVASAPLLIETGTAAKPHALFAALAIGALGAAGLFLATGRAPWWRAAAVALGLAAATLEYAPVLLLAVVGGALLARRGAAVPVVAEAIAIATVVLVVVWPGALFSLSLAKSYLFFAYQATLRAADYGTMPLWRIWAGRVAESPQLAVAALVGVGALVARRTRPGLLPCALYVAGLLLANGRNHSLYAPYAASLVAPLGVVLGVGGLALAGAARPALAALGGLALAMPLATWWLAWPGLAARLGAGGDLVPVVAAAREGRLAPPDGGCVSVPFALVPRLHFYAPSVPVRPYYPAERERFGPCTRSVALAGEAGAPRWVVVSR